MGEYSVSVCIDKNGSRPLSLDTAVFVRRIDPPLWTVYTIICDSQGRARPWQATRAGASALQTGPVRLSTECVYLAAWIPASQLSRQGDVAAELGRMGRDSRYEFQPTQQDQRLRRIQAARWQGRAPGYSAADAALLSVLNETGLSSLAAQALVSPQAVRRGLASQIAEELEEVKNRELGAGFVLGRSDVAGRLRDNLLTNPAYRGANARRRAEMIADWQRRLQTASR